MYLLLLAHAVSKFRSDHAVTVSVVSKYNDVGLFEQVCVCVNRYLKEGAKQFLIRGLQEKVFLKGPDEIWELCQKFVDIDLLGQMKASVAVGGEIPRVLYHGTSENSTRNAVETIYETDFVFGDNPDFVLAADLIRDCDEILQLLNNQVSFVLRLRPQTKVGKMQMRGYGVELKPFKYSMEYGVKNTAEKVEESTGVVSVIDETTANMKPSLDDNLENISYLDFDHKLSSYLTSNDFDSLPVAMRDIVSNWPLHLKRIDETPVTNKAINDVRRIIDEQFETVSLNGRVIENIEQTDVFTMLEYIKQESVLTRFLTELNLSKSVINSFVTSPIPDHNAFRFSFMSECVDFFNDLEHDSWYSEWPADSKEFTLANMVVRKNLLNVILYIDPSSAVGMSSLVTLWLFVRRKMPFRLGIVPRFNFGNPLSRKIGLAYHYIATLSPRDAILFLLISTENIDLATAKTEDFVFSEEMWANAYQMVARRFNLKLGWNELLSLVNEDCPALQRVRRNGKYLKDLGIDGNFISFNGRIAKLPMIDRKITSNFYKEAQFVCDVLTSMKIDSLPKEDIDEVLDQETVVWDRFDEWFLNSKFETIHFLQKSFDEQLKFANCLPFLNWNGLKNAKSFCFVYCGNDTNLTVFQNVFNNVKWVINPDLYSFPQEDLPCLVINGRILRNVALNDEQQLRLIRAWNVEFVEKHISKFIATDNNVQSFILSMILNEWRERGINRTNNGLSLFNIKDNPLIHTDNTNTLNLTVVMNPFTRVFQRSAGMFEFLSRYKAVNLQLALNPGPNATLYANEFGSYYRSVYTSNEAVFTYLNDTTTYSTMLNTPHSWDVESLSSEFDVDNILLSELPSTVHMAKYLLSGVIIEGYCHDENGSAATGAILKTADADTTVMKHRGYFQLPGDIGVNVIECKSPGFILSNSILSIDTFATTYHSISVEKTGSSTKRVINDTPSNISRVDVFAVASGHLYERLLKIMMISVIRHTESHVTFWILKNFLSPQFKASLPDMATKYKFQYKLVKYNWPEWVVPQHEKQRIIWGNKILFLDELFPSDLKRVIYVDADQIVRTDLHELMTMDFESAPYAFTPFCDSRPETEPYRFWKQGSWKQHLRGRKYHISALFAVDLEEFRKRGAGDLLRKTYSSLAVDGHSLANLDQDLPNFLQGMLPIFSLPQNWLWCETWCSDETMDEAKTIDLCNNPLTKIPKLKIAQTRVKEWPGLDNEARQISADVYAYENRIFL